jgi:hypothetical protein
MGLLDDVKGMLTQYATGAAPAGDAGAHFDQMARSVDPSTIAQGLAALAEFAVTGRDPVRLDEHHRIELLRIEGEWLVRHGHTPT